MKRAEIEEKKFAGTGIILFGSGYVLKYFLILNKRMIRRGVLLTL